MLFVLAFGRLPFPPDSKLPILYARYDMPPGRHPLLRCALGCKHYGFVSRRTQCGLLVDVRSLRHAARPAPAAEESSGDGMILYMWLEKVAQHVYVRPLRFAAGQAPAAEVRAVICLGWLFVSVTEQFTSTLK